MIINSKSPTIVLFPVDLGRTHSKGTEHDMVTQVTIVKTSMLPPPMTS